MSRHDNFDTERFITEIEMRRGIWDMSSSDYSYRDLKRQLWIEITNIFGGENSDEKEKTELGSALQKKWKNIRDSFQRELRRLKGVRSGSAAQRKSCYVYFNQLLFLRPMVENNPTESSIPDSPQAETNNDDVADISPTRESTQSLRSKRKKGSQCDNDGVQDLVAILKGSVEARGKMEARNESDSDRMFLLSLLDGFKNIPTAAKMKARIELMETIDRYQPYGLQSERFNQNNNYSNAYLNTFQEHHPGYSTIPRAGTSYGNATDRSNSQQVQSPESEYSNTSQHSEILDLFR